MAEIPGIQGRAVVQGIGQMNSTLQNFDPWGRIHSVKRGRTYFRIRFPEATAHSFLFALIISMGGNSNVQKCTLVTAATRHAGAIRRNRLTVDGRVVDEVAQRIARKVYFGDESRPGYLENKCVPFSNIGRGLTSGSCAPVKPVATSVASRTNDPRLVPTAGIDLV